MNVKCFFHSKSVVVLLSLSIIVESLSSVFGYFVGMWVVSNDTGGLISIF